MLNASTPLLGLTYCWPHPAVLLKHADSISQHVLRAKQAVRDPPAAASCSCLVPGWLCCSSTDCISPGLGSLLA